MIAFTVLANHVKPGVTSLVVLQELVAVLIKESFESSLRLLKAQECCGSFDFLEIVLRNKGPEIFVEILSEMPRTKLLLPVRVDQGESISQRITLVCQDNLRRKFSTDMFQRLQRPDVFVCALGGEKTQCDCKGFVRRRHADNM